MSEDYTQFDHVPEPIEQSDAEPSGWSPTKGWGGGNVRFKDVFNFIGHFVEKLQGPILSVYFLMFIPSAFFLFIDGYWHLQQYPEAQLVQMAGLFLVLMLPLFPFTAGISRPIRNTMFEGTEFDSFGPVLSQMATRYWTMAGVMTILPFMVAFGCFACAVPGLVILSAVTPITYVAATRQCGVLDSIETGLRWTKKHWKLELGVAALLLAISLFMQLSVRIPTTLFFEGAFQEAATRWLVQGSNLVYSATAFLLQHAVVTMIDAEESGDPISA